MDRIFLVQLLEQDVLEQKSAALV
jgi:di/tricarboxylate transporter